MIAAHQATQAGLAGARLQDAAILAFLHSMAGGCLVAGGVAAAGALVAFFLLPARPPATATREIRPPAATDTTGTTDSTVAQHARPT